MDEFRRDIDELVKQALAENLDRDEIRQALLDAAGRVVNEQEDSDKNPDAPIGD